MSAAPAEIRTIDTTNKYIDSDNCQHFGANWSHQQPL